LVIESWGHLPPLLFICIFYGFHFYNSMKKTLDDKNVPSRCWYYLLDFNQRTNFKFIKEVEPDGDGRVSLLTYDKFWELFKIATEFEIKGDWSEFD